MTEKTWRFLALAYSVVYVLGLFIEGHDLERGPLSAADKIAPPT